MEKQSQTATSLPKATILSIARYFDFEGEGTTYRRKIVGGITTFLAMAYILFVNPQILTAAGIP